VQSHMPMCGHAPQRRSLSSSWAILCCGCSVGLQHASLCCLQLPSTGPTVPHHARSEPMSHLHSKAASGARPYKHFVFMRCMAVVMMSICLPVQSAPLRLSGGACSGSAGWECC